MIFDKKDNTWKPFPTDIYVIIQSKEEKYYKRSILGSI